jgi:hypothetical protein
MPDDSPPLDDLLDELQSDVARRRQEAGTYPPAVQALLADHDARLRGDTEALADAIAAIGRVPLTRAAISHESARPGGEKIHDVVGKLVGREIEGVLQQTRELAEAVQRAALALVAEMKRRDDLDLLQQIDDLQARIVEQQRQLDELRARG